MRLSLYWKCQLLGWSLASLFRNFIAFPGEGFHVSIALVNFVLDLIIGISISHAYRMLAVARGWQQLDPRQLFGRLIVAIAVMGVGYMLLVMIKNYGMRSFF